MKGVGHCEQAGTDWDVPTRKLVGIAATIPPLMVVANYRERGFQVGISLDHVRAENGVHAHLGPLVLVQRSGLGEHLLRNSNLAHVVEDRAEFESIQVVLSPIQLETERLGVGVDGLDVAQRVFPGACFYGVGHGAQDRLELNEHQLI